MKKIISIFLVIVISIFGLVGCGEEEKNIDLPNVTSAIQDLSQNTLKDSFYSIEGDTLKVMFIFDKDVLREGPCKLIREKLLDSLEGQYNKIDLNITQTKPSRNYVNFQYRDGVWEQK